MLSDIYQEPLKIEIEGKEYLLEFNHTAYAAFENKTHKSIFEVYDDLILRKHLLSGDLIDIVCCSMLKNHSKEEIIEAEEHLKNHPGILQEEKEKIATAFLVPLLPPKLLKKINEGNKKKEQSTNSKMKRTKKQNTNG